MKNKKNMKQIITLTIIGVILWTYQPKNYPQSTKPQPLDSKKIFQNTESTLKFRVKNDTFTLCKKEMHEFAVIWKKDTILTETSYAKPYEIIESLDKMGFENCFMLNLQYGDGCPTMYRVLQIKEKGFFVSEAFGNCHDEISEYKVQYPLLKIKLNASPDFGKPEMKHIFDAEKSSFWDVK
jgi:hypothetical protein